MSKRAQYYLFPFSSFLPAPQHPLMLPSGRGAGRAQGFPGAHRYLPPTFHPHAPPLGELAVLPPPPDPWSRLSPVPPQPHSPPSRLPEGSVWGGRVPCCPCLEDLALAQVARRGWNFLVLLEGGHFSCQPPVWGTSEMAMLSTPPGPPPPSSAPTGAPRAGDFLW